MITYKRKNDDDMNIFWRNKIYWKKTKLRQSLCISSITRSNLAFHSLVSFIIFFSVYKVHLWRTSTLWVNVKYHRGFPEIAFSFLLTDLNGNKFLQQKRTRVDWNICLVSPVRIFNVTWHVLVVSFRLNNNALRFDLQKHFGRLASLALSTKWHFD